jgi:hypothetical protein
MRALRCLLGIHHWHWTTRAHPSGWLNRVRTCQRCNTAESWWLR